MCSPLSSVEHCTIGSDLASRFRPSTNFGNSEGFFGSTATRTTGDTENFIICKIQIPESYCKERNSTGQGTMILQGYCPVVRDKYIFLPGKSIFIFTCPMNGQVVCQLNRKKSNPRLTQGKQNLRASCSKGKLEFKFFFEP